MDKVKGSARDKREHSRWSHRLKREMKTGISCYKRHLEKSVRHSDHDGKGNAYRKLTKNRKCSFTVS